MPPSKECDANSTGDWPTVSGLLKRERAAAKRFVARSRRDERLYQIDVHREPALRTFQDTQRALGKFWPQLRRFAAQIIAHSNEDRREQPDDAAVPLQQDEGGKLGEPKPIPGP